MKYFTSDQHFYDPDIMQFADRPYDSIEAMNEDMIGKFVRATYDADEIYILGDIFGSKQPEDPFSAAKEIMDRLGIHKKPFCLMRGNHDHLTDEQYREIGFHSVFSKFAFINIQGREAMIMHDPCMLQPRGAIGICGHVHTLFHEVWNEHRGSLVINVSVDVRHFAPISERDVLDIISSSPF